MTDHAYEAEIDDIRQRLASIATKDARIAELEEELSHTLERAQAYSTEIASLRAENERLTAENQKFMDQSERWDGSREAHLSEALKPFAACVYNDNGDVTISTGHLRTGDYMKARALLSGGKNV